MSLHIAHEESARAKPDHTSQPILQSIVLEP